MHRKGDKGFSLVELMVGLAIGLTVVVVAGYVYVLNARSSGANLQSSTLEQEINAAMEIMTAEIRRAGYWDVDDNDVPDPYGHLNIVDYGGNSRSCILFFYDSDRDGAVDNGELRGFRRNGALIQTRTACTTGLAACITANDACDKTDNSDTWQALTDNNLVSVTALDFSTTGSKCLNLGDTAAASGTRALDFWEVTSTTSADFSCPCDGTTTGICYHNYDDSNSDPYLTYPITSTCGTASCAEVPLTNDSVIGSRQVNINLQAQVVGDAAISKDADTSLRVQNNLYCKTGVDCP